MLLSKFGEGLTVTLVGLSVVFLGLIIIIAMIYLFSAVFKIFNKNKRAAAPAPKAVPAPAAAPAPAVEEPAAESDDNELVAVITAALAAYMADENVPDDRKLVIRRIRKVNSWNNAAREEQVYRF